MKINPYEDGETHINIYSKANTFLGKCLSNWWDYTVECSLGQFRCIEGLIFYLGSFDENLRSMNGFEAKKYGSQVDRGIRLPEDIFKRIIIEAMRDKLSNPNFRRSLKESKLPLTHYYVYSGKPVFIPKWDWQVEEWEKIRKELQSE